MEDSNNIKDSKHNYFLNKIKEKKKLLTIILTILVLTLFGLGLLYHLEDKKNKDLSEKFISANILLSQENRESALKIYLEIIDEKNKFYSISSLNQIIENDLIIDKDKILKLFDKTLSINGIGEQKDLLLIKKALFLSKNKIDKKSLEILEKIKNSKSLWKDLAEINYNVLSKN